MAMEKKSLWKKIKGKLSVVEEGATPPNWKYIGLMFVAMFSSSYSLIFLFPFLPEMILSFGYTEEEKGYYVGLVASGVFAGRAVGSYLWGYLSDVKGRRIVLLTCMFFVSLSSLAFGFSTNLAMAISFRFILGAFNGIIGTSKAVLYEISDDTNQAIAMSICSVAWGTGMIAGPSISGWLASPTVKYPSVFGDNWFLVKYAYFLPCLICFIVCIVSFIVIYFKFEETIHLKRQIIITEEPDKENSEKKSFLSVDSINKLNSVDNLRSSTFVSVENLHMEAEAATFIVQDNLRKEQLADSKENLHKRIVSANHNASVSNDNVKTNLIGCKIANNLEHDNTNQSNGNLKDNGVVKIVVQDSEDNVSEKAKGLCSNSNIITLLKDSNVRGTILLYTIYSFGVIGFEDVFTIWASTEKRLDGLGFSTSEIGTTFGAVAIPLLLIQIKLFPLLVSYLGIKNSFLSFSIVTLVCCQLVPSLHLIPDNKVVLWTFLILLLLGQKLGSSSCFSASSILINNSCFPNMIGTANGIGMTCTAIARTLAPTVGGSLFAWSIGHGMEEFGPPFDVNITFVVMGIVFTISAIICVTLPNTLDKQRKQTDTN